jgi:hypothetical protein
MIPADRALYRTLLGAHLSLHLAYGVWLTLFNNFAVEELSLSATQVGLTQSFREVPGLLGFGLGLLALVFSEMRLVSLSLVALGAGVAWTSYAGSLASLIGATVLLSFGFHYFMSAARSAALHRFTESFAAKALPRFFAAQSFATLIAAGLVWLVLLWGVGYRPIFLWSGVAAALVGALGLFRKDTSGKATQERRGLALRKSYALYYALTFFDGCRRHMFTTFAVFLLVKEFRTPAHVVAALFFVNYGVSALANWALVGALINRLGERRLLMVNYLLLAGVFSGYILVHNVWILYGLFVLDGVFFGLSIAVTTYLQKIAPREDITGNISAGQSINHIAAVTMPLAGGIIWDLYDYRLTFAAGLAIVVVSFALAGMIKVKGDADGAVRQA